MPTSLVLRRISRLMRSNPLVVRKDRRYWTGKLKTIWLSGVISSLRIKYQKSGKIIIDQLRPNRLDKLDEVVNNAFNDSLIENYEGTYNKGINFLIKKLNEIGVDIVDG